MTGGCERGTITFDSSSQSASSAPSALGLAGYAIALREQGGGRGDEYSRHYMQSESVCPQWGDESDGLCGVRRSVRGPVCVALVGGEMRRWEKVVAIPCPAVAVVTVTAFLLLVVTVTAHSSCGRQSLLQLQQH